jgi:hypothetical protein
MDISKMFNLVYTHSNNKDISGMTFEELRTMSGEIIRERVKKHLDEIRIRIESRPP